MHMICILTTCSIPLLCGLFDVIQYLLVRHCIRTRSPPSRWKQQCDPIFSFNLTGAAKAILLPYLGLRIEDLNLDGKAELLFLGQLTATVAILTVLFGIIGTFKPFPEDIFRYDLKDPFNLRNGWLLWAGIGLVGGILSIGLTGAALTSINGEPPQRETDALIHLLPFLGSSNVSLLHMKKLEL